MVQELDEKAQQVHPFADAEFDFPIQVVVDRGSSVRPRIGFRKGIAHGNDYNVALNEGEVYQLWAENRSGHSVLMRLLVDGRNTLPERNTIEKQIVVEQVGQRVILDNAKSWVLDPETIRDPSKKK